MTINIKDTLVKSLEENPQLYKIFNSKDYILVLEEFYCKKNLNIEDLQRNINIKKYAILYNILDSLIKEKLIKKIKVDNNDIYFITDTGKKIIELYKKTKEEFKL